MKNFRLFNLVFGICLIFGSVDCSNTDNEKNFGKTVKHYPDYGR